MCMFLRELNSLREQGIDLIMFVDAYGEQCSGCVTKLFCSSEHRSVQRFKSHITKSHQ